MNKSTTQTLKAVAYCRKSTAEDGAEQSIRDQLRRIRELKPTVDGARYEIVRVYSNDLGVPGWKRGAARPDYHRLVEDIRKHKDVQAILVDDFDRFSRSDPMETLADVQALRELGVRYLHAVNQGCRDLVEGGAMVAMQIAMEANASHEFSTRLARRIAEARKREAEKGRRTGGPVPYGYQSDGNGSLVLAEPDKVERVRWIFSEFVRGRSMNSIARELNERNVPSPAGKRWSAVSIRNILLQPTYTGTFVFGRNPVGEFYRIDTNGSVVKVSRYADDKPTNGNGRPAFVHDNTHPAIIDNALFDQAQQRIAGFERGKRRPRDNRFPLAGILRCGHCGGLLYGRRYRKKTIWYICLNGSKADGAKPCRLYGVREDVILPVVVRLLTEEIETLLRQPQSQPPELATQGLGDAERKQLEARLEAVKGKIDKAVENLMLADARTRPLIDSKLKQLWEEHDALQAKLQTPEPQTAELAEAGRALAAWWETFKTEAVKVPLDADRFHDTVAFLQAMGEEPVAYVDPAAFNEALHSLGCEITLRWRTETITLANGKTQNRYTLERGRFRLGQKTGQLRGYDLLGTPCGFSRRGRSPF